MLQLFSPCFGPLVRGVRICLCAFCLLLPLAEAHAATTNVTYGFAFFNPKVVQIHAGDTVNWTGGSGHTLLGTGTDPICGGNSLPCSHTFNVPGSYAYKCTIDSHAALGMTGLVVVVSAPLTPPVLTNAVWLPQGWLQFTLLSSGTQTNILLASTNVVSPTSEWTPIATNTSKTNMLIFTDTNAPNYPQRFYKVAEPN